MNDFLFQSLNFGEAGYISISRVGDELVINLKIGASPNAEDIKNTSILAIQVAFMKYQTALEEEENSVF